MYFMIQKVLLKTSYIKNRYMLNESSYHQYCYECVSNNLKRKIQVLCHYSCNAYTEQYSVGRSVINDYDITKVTCFIKNAEKPKFDLIVII